MVIEEPSRVMSQSGSVPVRLCTRRSPVSMSMSMPPEADARPVAMVAVVPLAFTFHKVVELTTK